MNTTLTAIGSANIPVGNTVITDQYQLQVAGFLNRIKEEVEDAWNWRALWNVYTFIYPAAVLSQPIVDMSTGAFPGERCRTARMTDKRVGKEVALCFDITSFGIPFPMAETPKAGLLYYNTVFNQVPVQYSTNFAVDISNTGIVNLLVYPGANQPRTIQITLVNPQARIDPTIAGATGGLDTPIYTPASPIEYGTIWYALQERGEELGTSTVFTEERFRTAIDDAIARDQEESGGIEMTVA